MGFKLQACVAAALWLAAVDRMCAQGARDGAGAPAPTAQAAAPVDLTGYWVSLVTEDWRFRMLTPAKGDYASVPLNAAARKAADAWDPAKDEAAGLQCKSYGAPAVMRVPGRVHITWENENTLRIDTDAGTQTRQFHFGGAPTPAGEPSWQGYSAAEWEYAGGVRVTGASGVPRAGDLKVITSRLRPGYLRKNGVPYSGNAALTEYYHRIVEPNGDTWLVVTTLVEDPQYLDRPFQTSTHFRKQADSAGWDPTPCTSR